ncbi:hypothetical protein SmJEL517_g01161 [Synchytrium microbalum]|uniref:alcohol dehydrogenase n=1 Tax=Synchytrium microbalum TaxID=1806994 RepID=A0A507CGI1_9FUNG|nr:uncharacterized protein SmJEL517_g01161 [Synchytrium microbalum]TPX36735.1 hypothetical protein SmJEL517_g01161 [Synchytrium microbalum]
MTVSSTGGPAWTVTGLSSLLLPFSQLASHIISTFIMTILIAFALSWTAHDPIERAQKKDNKEKARRRISSPGSLLSLLAEESNVDASKALNDIDNCKTTPRNPPRPLVDTLGIKMLLGNRRNHERPALMDPNVAKMRKISTSVEYYATFHGYECDTHRATTLDGFSLLLHRIRAKSSTSASSPRKETILLVHGLFQSSGVFVTNGRGSLAFYLADLGYDVWLGNNRCVERLHCEFKSSDIRFWDWSLDELAKYDLPAMVDYVRRASQVEKIIYIGHSQGNAQVFLGLKLDPALSNKISCFVALAPTAYIGPLLNTAPLKYMVAMSSPVYRAIFGIKEFLPIMNVVQAYFPTSLFMSLAYSMFAYLFSWHDENWDESHKPHYFQFTPRPTSAKAILHWARCAKLRTLVPWSSTTDDNTTPAPYSTSYDFSCLGDIKLALFYGSRDRIIDGDRVMREARGKCNLVYGEHLDGYEHLDVVWAVDAKSRVFDPIALIFDRLRESKKIKENLPTHFANLPDSTKMEDGIQDHDRTSPSDAPDSSIAIENGPVEKSAKDEIPDELRIPKAQRAAVVFELGKPVVFEDNWPVSTPGTGEVLVHVIRTGVCHSDLHTMEGATPGTPLPHIGGHEGAGFVVAVGAEVHDVKVGDRVGIKFISYTCGTCEYCLAGHETVCERQQTTGLAIPGTFQQYVIAKAQGLARIPAEVSFDQAAPILCAGISVYKGLKELDIKAGQWVCVPGAGGGLGHLAVQYAKAMGFRCLAIDGGESKRELCLQLGADSYLDFLSTKDVISEVIKITKGGAHGALIVATSQVAYSQAPLYMRPWGTIVCISLPANAKLDSVIADVVMRRLTIRGSVMGDRLDTAEALDFVARGLVKCIVEEYPLSALNDVYSRMRKGDIAGRILLNTAE